MKTEIIDYSALDNWATQYLFAYYEVYTQKRYPLVPIRRLVQRQREDVFINDDMFYRQVTLKTKFLGMEVRSERAGREIRTRHQFKLNTGQLLISKIDARNGACAIVPENLSGAIVTSNFWVYQVKDDLVRPKFLLAVMNSKRFMDFAENSSNGSTGRHYLQEENFLNFSIPLPDLFVQDEILSKLDEVMNLQISLEKKQKLLKERTWRHVSKELGIDEQRKVEKRKKCFQVIDFVEMINWDINIMTYFQAFNSDKYPTFTLGDKIECIELAKRGKSPRYDIESSVRMINQQSVRNCYVDLKYAKGIKAEWAETVDSKEKTQEGDILVCSTGNGTIGRAAIVDSGCEGYLYDSHVLLLRVDKRSISPVLLCYLINSQYGQKQIERLKSARTTNQTELGIANLLKMCFPFPPLSVQKRLANYLRGKINLEDSESGMLKGVREASKLLDTFLYS